MTATFRKQTRREFVQTAAAGVTTLVGAASVSASTTQKAEVKMFKNLGCGHIGVEANQKEAIEYAAKFGFGGASPDVGELERMSAGQRREITARLNEKGLRWGASGLPVEFRRDEDRYRKDIEGLPKRAEVLREMGVTRVSTWIMPGHETLTYLANFEQHRRRLESAARILNDEGIRLGLEFVGPRDTRKRFRFAFVCTQAEMLELCNAIGTGNVGLLLDSWHWHTSHGTVDELIQLTNEMIIEVHVNDAPKGIPTDELRDARRALPLSTGVIDLKAFMNVLYRIGYDGPITCEPFDDELRKMDNEQALQKTIDALNRLFDLIET
jgi:sugar phosphate isomerase/epimerase